MASGAPPCAPDQDWSRAGAHNIAGVSFQVAVTAKLLVARRGRVVWWWADPRRGVLSLGDAR